MKFCTRTLKNTRILVNFDVAAYLHMQLNICSLGLNKHSILELISNRKVVHKKTRVIFF